MKPLLEGNFNSQRGFGNSVNLLLVVTSKRITKVRMGTKVEVMLVGDVELLRNRH